MDKINVSVLKKTKGFLLDLIFPSFCIGCKKEGDFLCDECLKEIEFISTQFCPVCEKTITPNGEVCGTCKKENLSSIDQMIVAANYQDKLLAKAVHLFKYKFVQNFSSPLGKILCQSLQKNNLKIPDLIIPIPLHDRRFRWRGFNQAEVLAKEVAKNLTPGIEIEVDDSIMKRTKNTTPQMKIKSRGERQKNIKNAFSVSRNIPKNYLKGKNILLVDDICTTGSTIQECAKVFKKLKPKTITAVVVARQS